MGNQGSTASGKPVSSMYEIARLASHTSGRRAGFAENLADGLVAVLRATLLTAARAS